MIEDETKAAAVVSVPREKDVEIADVQADAIHSDEGYELFKQSLELEPEERDEIAKKVLLKLDFILLPMVGVVQTALLAIVLTMVDVLCLSAQLPRQADAQLFKRIRSTGRFGAAWQSVLMGSFNHQHRVLGLRLSFQRGSPKVPHREICCHQPHGLGHNPHAHDDGQKLCWHHGFALRAWWSRGMHRSCMDVADEHFLEEGRTVIQDVVVAG